MSFQRIVVPYEGGALSEDALRLACDLAEDGAKITAVYVVKVTPGTPIGAEEVRTEAAEKELERAKEIGEERRVDLETYLAKSPEVAEGITETAATLGADAIVMSLRHKHTPAETLVLSHTASRILRHAPCRVLITYRRD